MTTEPKRTPKFGDWMRGIYASEGNPIRDGIFVRKSGHYYQLTDGKGYFWRYPPESVVFIDTPEDSPIVRRSGQ